MRTVIFIGAGVAGLGFMLGSVASSANVEPHRPGTAAARGAHMRSHDQPVPCASGYPTTSFNAIHGVSDHAGGDDSAILAGTANEACDSSSSVSGGDKNVVGVGASESFIGGGNKNGITATAGSSFVGAGSGNTVSGSDAFVGAGLFNIASGVGSFVGSGNTSDEGLTVNKASGEDAFIGAGDDNAVAGPSSFVGAGGGNSVSGISSGVGAGNGNSISSSVYNSFVGAGVDDLVSGDVAFVGAGVSNIASGTGSFVGSGNTFVTGGRNTASGQDAFIGAGDANTVSGIASFIGAGEQNGIAGNQGFIGSGQGNRILAGAALATIGGGASSVVSGPYGTVGGGAGNLASGSFATVPGGFHNIASGVASFAAGYVAEAATAGSFVWSDDAATTVRVRSTLANEFLARASGGVAFYSNATLTSGVRLAPGGGSWSSLSDRAMKSGVAPIDDAAVLAKVAALPVSEWSYTSEHGVRHVGPMAQDFYAAFRVGEDDRHITSIDEDGVALAAIKALQAENAALRRQLATSRAREDQRFGRLERSMAELAATIGVKGTR